MKIAAALGGALALARDGLPSFPCRADKRPATPRGFQDAVSDPDELRQLWRRHPGLLIGVPTGEASGAAVLDLDIPRHPEAGEWWTLNRHRLPQTRTHRTRSGGLHLLYRHRPGLRCWAGRPVPGIDGRADGGYIIWWPAAEVPVLCDVPSAPWPAWLLVDLQSSTSPVRPNVRVTVPDEYALANLVRLVAGAPPGQRNNLAYWAACRAGEMVASGLIGAETAAAVIARAAMRAGLSQPEAERTAWSGLRTGQGAANA
jgi:hypothetical protein